MVEELIKSLRNVADHYTTVVGAGSFVHMLCDAANNLEIMSTKLKEETQRRKKAEDDAESLANRLIDEHTMLRECRNELCVKCGKYAGAFRGACDGCRWKETMI